MTVQNTTSESIEFSDEYRWNKLLLRKFEVCIVEVFQFLRAAGIEPILIKGWAANQFYPENRPRSFSDIDIAVSSSDFDNATDLLGNFNKRVSIDLHHELRHLDNVAWPTIFERSKLKRVDDFDIRILSPEDHLRVLCTHWLNDGGQYRERLWDIYFAVENRPENFDWSLCLDSVSRTRRQWVLMTVFAAHKYLDLDILNLPFADEITKLPDWMEKCIEKEWATNVRLLPLHTVLNDRKRLIEQIRKRFPPNPIQATIENEAGFDESSRLRYQIMSVFKRTVPSIKRLFPTVFGKHR